MKSACASYQRIFAGITGLTLLLSLSISGANPAVASLDEVKWARVDIPTEGKAGDWVLADGSDVQHLIMASDGTLYAYAKGLTYTLYKSTDDGYSWSYIGDVQDEIVDIATAPDDTSFIYYATTSDVYRSTDGGKKFISLPANPGGAGSNNIEIASIDVTRLTENIIAVGTRDTDNSQYGGVYTLDEEEFTSSWVDTNLGNYDVYAVAFSPDYAADRQLVAVATDETDTFITSKIGDNGWGANIGNATLDKDNSGTPTSVAVTASAAIAFPGNYESEAGSTNYVQFIAIDTGSGNGDVYRIDGVDAPGNSATTDLDIGSAYDMSNIDVTGLAAAGDAASANLLAGAADSAQTYFSDDAGISWTRSRKEPTGGSETYVLMAPDFTSSHEAYAATSGSESAFSVSQDKGNIWNQVGLIDTGISTIVDLAPSPSYSQDNTLFMLSYGSEHSLWRSLDGGTIWERIFSSTLVDIDSLQLVELPPQYGNNSQVVFIAGSSNSRSGIWKSKDNGQRFNFKAALDPDTGASFSIDAWTIVDDTTLFIGSYDGSNGLVYRTTNSGFLYSTGAVAGSHSINSIVLSPNYEQDEAILLGNTNGWVHWSDDNGISFEPLPPDATSAPLTDSLTIAFDSDFDSNNTIYAASDTADKGVYRFKIGTSTDWESIDSTLPSGGMLNRIIVSADGTLYAANSDGDGGMERSLNPTYSLGPTFETVTRGLSDGATLSGLWQNDRRLWSVDTTSTKLLTFDDSLPSQITQTSPSDNASGIGAIVNHTISDVRLDWEALSGATTYKWQLDYDTDFSSVPDGFEADTKASSARLPTLEPGTTYYWRVRATEPVLSPWSDKWTFTTSLDTEAVALKLESPKAGTTGVSIRPLFQWNAVSGAESYELVISTKVDLSNPSILKLGDYALPSTAWHCNLSLDYDTTYYWKVRAISGNTRSEWSAVGGFTTESAPSTSPPETPPASPTPPQVPIVITPPAPAPAPTPPTPPPPPAPTPAQFPNTPDWAYLIGGALLLTIILLLIIILLMVVVTRRP